MCACALVLLSLEGVHVSVATLLQNLVVSSTAQFSQPHSSSGVLTLAHNFTPCKFCTSCLPLPSHALLI